MCGPRTRIKRKVARQRKETDRQLHCSVLSITITHTSHSLISLCALLFPPTPTHISLSPSSPNLQHNCTQYMATALLVASDTHSHISSKPSTSAPGKQTAASLGCILVRANSSRRRMICTRNRLRRARDRLGQGLWAWG